LTIALGIRTGVYIHVELEAADFERLLVKMGMPPELPRRPPPYNRIDAAMCAASPSTRDDAEDAFYDWARARLASAIDSLSWTEQAVISLRYLCAVTHTQERIALLLRLDQSAVSRADSRAIAKLRARIAHADAHNI
jgi:DNA-directed RNA polymerase specialized sigma24 family protein